MPTIFERITGALADNHVSVQVTVQGGALTSTASLISGLIEKPPGELGSLSAALQALPLPGLAISGKYAQALTGLAGAVLEVVAAAYAATQADLLCTAKPAAPGGGADGVPPPASGAGGSGGTAGAPAGITTPAPVQQLNGILDLFPQPLNLTSLLDWLYRILKGLDLSSFHIVQVPILDDLRDPLVTLITWRNAMSTAELVGHLHDSLNLLENTVAGSVDTVLTPIETALAAVSAQLPTAPL